MLVMKREGTRVRACCLGEDSPMEKDLIDRGLLTTLPDGTYRVKSREAGEGPGQAAKPGDYVKLDSEGYPYPNSREFFLCNHEKVGEEYVQIPRQLEAWAWGEPESEALDWAKRSGRLSLSEDDPDHAFRSEQWGTSLSAPSDAVLVFYSVKRADDGSIADLSFNFVVREEFEKSYRIVSPADARNKSGLK